MSVRFGVLLRLFDFEDWVFGSYEGFVNVRKLFLLFNYFFNIFFIVVIFLILVLIFDFLYIFVFGRVVDEICFD